jgi:hypothetical protein
MAAASVVRLAKPCSTAATYTIVCLTKSCFCWATSIAYTIVHLAKLCSTTATYIVARLAKLCPTVFSSPWHDGTAGPATTPCGDG